MKPYSELLLFCIGQLGKKAQPDTTMTSPLKTDEQQDPMEVAYRNIKGNLIIQGTSLAKWCRENGTDIQNLRHAFKGKWNGPRAKKLREKALSDAGVVLEETT